MSQRPWLELLRRLTATAPSWGVWKRPDSALHGHGDIDSVAAKTDWETIVREFRGWSSENGFGPVALCTHIPSMLILVACDGDRPTRLLQMDVYSRYFFRGAPIVDAGGLNPLMELDSRGFRRLQPGAEAMLVLLHEGIRHGGRPAGGAIPREIVERLRQDVEGAEEFAALTGLSPRVVRAVANGEWRRSSTLAFEVRTMSRVLGHPRDAGTIVARNYRRIRRCPVIEALRAGRCVPGDRTAWLQAVRRSHIVYE